MAVTVLKEHADSIIKEVSSMMMMVLLLYIFLIPAGSDTFEKMAHNNKSYFNQSKKN